MNYLFLFLLVIPQMIWGIEFDTLEKKLSASQSNNPPFNYPLNLTVLKGQSNNEDVFVAIHGYGGNYTLGTTLQSYKVIPSHLVTFDLPDHDAVDGFYDVKKSAFGTINELQPLLYILKKLAIDANIQTISLYGFSMGAGVLINTLAVLNTTRFDTQLLTLGITTEGKKAILKAIEHGWILLDSPFKSMEEINAFCKRNPTNDALTKRYRSNDFRPIDSLRRLQGLALNVIVYFEVPDEAVKNRDDDLYFQKLQQFNPNGKNIVIKGSTGGHCSYHISLWETYRKLLAKQQD